MPNKTPRFGNWKSLRDYRISKGVSIADIAAILECSEQHISRVERGIEELIESERIRITLGRVQK